MNVFFPMISEMSKDMADGEGTVKVRIHLHQGLYFGGDDRVLFAVGGQTPREVMSAFSKVFDRIDSILRTALSAGRIDTCTEKTREKALWNERSQRHCRHRDDT